ncbi:hypothetical protein [Pseudomonas savastanoi]|uniref:hypothetical protein n=1 Tax=Pseudomonas savastanoi TaxID=29438 RepID=UPI000F3F1FD5|nr:hypothetical protein [Pseudomonas savastanoi]RML88192.1 hypothetical protein ALQ87_01101 [Pseudomonas savastanoi pv. glycinea]
MYITKSFTPQELFEMVWTTPVLKLAREIGVSDVGLSKACRRAGIVLPARGYWAKSEAKRPKRPKPPTQTIPIEFSVLDIQQTRLDVNKRVKPEPLLVTVPTELVDAHPEVGKWLSAARKAKVVDGALDISGACVLSARISSDAVARSALIFDTLIKESEKRGYRFSIKAGETHVIVDDEPLKISISEKLKRFEIPRPPAKPLRPGQPWSPNLAGLSRPRYGWESTGILTLSLDVRTLTQERKNWTDTDNARIEKRLGQVLLALPRLAQSAKSKQAADEDWQRKWDRDQRLKREAHDAGERRAKLQTSLVCHTESWERAMRLEAFIQATINAAPQDEQSQQQLTLWVCWARHEVQELNPLVKDVMAVTRMSTPARVTCGEGNFFYSKSVKLHDWWD